MAHLSSYESIPRAELLNTEILMVDIMAPESMPEGYKFSASYDGIVFHAIVPAGGVKKGQVFKVPFNAEVPLTIGRWKDDLFACTRFGIFHPSFVYAWCCPLMLLGQVMTRLKLNWLGDEALVDEWKSTFKNMTYATIAFAVLSTVFTPASPCEDTNIPGSIVNMIYSVYLIITMTKVRKIVRQRNNIQEEIKYEDCLASTFCGCCTVSQIARQTANYDCVEASFISPDGLYPPVASPVLLV